MSEQETVSGTKKRFFPTGNGRVKRKHAYKSHILIKKNKKRERNLTYIALVRPHNEHGVKEMLSL